MTEKKESEVKMTCSLELQGRALLLRSTLLLGAATAMALISMEKAQAFNLYAGTVNDQNLRINLDTTVEYSNIYRVNDPSAILAGPRNPNGNDGDSNFRHGFVDNTFDVLPVFDLRYGDYGAHVSGEFYLDTPYLQKNQNDQPKTFNPYTTGTNRDFTSATRNIMGQNAVLLDAFVYGSRHFGADGDQVASLKFGRQTLLWGQSLFFTNDGIAFGQAPVDTIKASSLPNPQAQQVFLPVGQAVFTYQPNETLTFQGYYQFEWAPNTFLGSGSYYSSADFFDKGGQRLILKPGAYAYRGKDNRPTHNGQFGVSVQANVGSYGLGLYALRFDSKAPSIYLGAPLKTEPKGSVGTYRLVYPRDIAIYGASLTTDIGPANVGGEISGRTNMPLVSGIGSLLAPGNAGGNANSHPLYAVGDTLNAQASTTYVSQALKYDPGGVAVAAEIEANHVLKVTANKQALTPGRTSTAANIQFVVTPSYYNVLPQLELQFPVGMKYGLLGNSELDNSSQNANHGNGTVSVGVTATYRTTWIAGLTYQDYFGKPNTALNPIADRGYVSFNIQHTF